MNNGNLRIETIPSELEDKQKEMLNSEEARLVKIIEALQAVHESKAWSSLKTDIFDSLVNVLEKDLRTEAERTDPSTNTLNRISGELKWARRFADLQKFAHEKRVELKGIRLRLYGKESE